MSAPTATFVAERHVRATRTTTWLVALEEFDAWGPWLVPIRHDAAICPEEVLVSHEPPWRRVTELRRPGCPPCQLTLALQDHGAQSHFVWAGLLPLQGDPAQDARDQAFLLGLQQEVERRADHLVRCAEQA